MLNIIKAAIKKHHRNQSFYDRGKKVDTTIAGAINITKYHGDVILAELAGVNFIMKPTIDYIKSITTSVDVFGKEMDDTIVINEISLNHWLNNFRGISGLLEDTDFDDIKSIERLLYGLQNFSIWGSRIMLSEEIREEIRLQKLLGDPQYVNKKKLTQE